MSLCRVRGQISQQSMNTSDMDSFDLLFEGDATTSNNTLSDVTSPPPDGITEIY